MRKQNLRILQVQCQLNYYSHMKTLLLFMLCLLGCHSHIYASDTKVTYDYDGSPLIYHLYMSLETGLGADDYLKVIWPFAFHVTNSKSDVKAKLISFSNNLEIVEVNCHTDPDTADPQYNIKFGVSLTAGKWYEIQIFPTLDPAVSLPYHGLIQVKAVSSLHVSHILYDSNMAFQYISIQSASGITNGMTIATTRQSEKAAAIHSLTIDITPQSTNPNGGNFTLSIFYDSSDTTHHNQAALGTTGQLDFQFMGLCQSISPTPGTAAAVLNYCEISDDLTKIYFSINSITGGSVIRIKTQVSNPLFQSTRGIRAHYVDFISGIVKENGFQIDALTVAPMTINKLTDSRVHLFWGIDKDELTSDSNLNELNLGLFKAVSSENLGPFNSFNIGFSFDETSPISGKYTLEMKLQADGFLQGSIAHNLPAYSGLQVYCSYDATTNKQIVCQNIGPFIKTGHRYFISGKAYYKNTAPNSILTFGDIKIKPVVFDSSGNAAAVTLYTPLVTAETINIKQSKQFLDTSGYHDTSSKKIGVAQVISHYDDGTLSSTANAMKDFMTGTNSTVGIVPDLGVAQQLLFLMKVDSTSMSGSGSGNDYQTRVLYNNKVIKFESGSQERGLDFVGYSNGDSEWSIEYAPCHVTGNVVCEKYNIETPDKNKQIRINEDGDQNFYGLYKFQCGTPFVASPQCLSSDCSVACNMFTGHGTADYQSTVMSMRKVEFPSTEFHSSLYADDSLLDFVIVFIRGGTYVSSTLINAYTIVGTKMQNIKASYVNHFVRHSNAYNKGSVIPTMIRIGGGILPKQSRSATVIGVFFDDGIDAKTFYSKKDESYEVGCSTSNCLYYPNTGLNLPLNDIWHTMRRVEFHDIPSVQNQFNLLVPVTPIDGEPIPDTLTIAFFTKDHQIADVTGLLKTVSVYRLFGSAVTEEIGTTGITAINGMVARTSGPNSDFTSNSISFGNTLNYYLNTANIIQDPPNNAFPYGFHTTLTVNGQYGAGVTITSLYYNIFKESSLYFESPPANTAEKCTIFGYIYNEISASYAYKDKQWIYTVFCPVDSTFKMNAAAANIQFENPQYPNVFTNGFPLQSVLAIAVSQPDGLLRAYKKDNGNIGSFTRSCSTSKLHPYNPSSSGKQRATFTVSTPQIRMSHADLHDGYSQFRVIITLPSGIPGITMQNQCEISDPQLSCTATGTTSSVTVIISYTGDSVMTVTYFELQLFAKTTGALGTQGNYDLKIQLPQYPSSGSVRVPFGSLYNQKTSYCQCSSIFKIGTTSYQTLMEFDTPSYYSNMKEVKTPIQFNFGSQSYRQAFFDTSYMQFDFGFLQNTMNSAKGDSNFRCLVYQNNQGTLSLSSKWEYIDLTSLSSVKLKPKYTIDEPAKYLYTMKCLGAAVPTGTSALKLKWVDSGADVQQATDIAVPDLTPAATGTFSINPSISKKRFKNQGMKAFYTFQMRASQNLNENSRIYFDFNFNLNSRLDREGKVECYIRPTLATSDQDAVFSYCEFTYTNQLVIWNNLEIPSTDTFYIDIFNIQQSLATDTSPNVITVSVDLDSDYTNGVHAIYKLNDQAASGISMNDIIIQKTLMNTTFIRSPQTITIEFTLPSSIGSNQYLYFMLPPSYAEWIKRGQTMNHTTDQCYLEKTSSPGANIIDECVFISKRILAMKLDITTTGTAHKLILNNIFSPSQIPASRNNQYRFKLFTASSDELQILAYSFTDRSKHLTLQINSNLIDLSWKYHEIKFQNSLVSSSDISSETFIIYIGYYSNFIQLRQSLYPETFTAQLALELNTFLIPDDIAVQDGAIVKLGVNDARFRFAAARTSTDIFAGLFTFQFLKKGDTKDQYTEVPPLTMVVSNKKCQLKTQETSYTLPIGGQTLPIRINAVACIPITDINITLQYNNDQVTTDADRSSLELTSNSIDGQLYFIAKHKSQQGGLSIGATVIATFHIAGTEAESFDNILSISINMVDPTSYQNLPGATALTNPTLHYNTATFILQCSMASRIYWGLGIYPSILNSQALDFQARIISQKKGLLTNFTQKQDIYKRTYGLDYVTTTQTFSKTIYSLKSNSQYIFRYYCINQLGLISDGQSITFSSLNYGAYLMKVSITLRGNLTYQQYYDLSCSLAENFKVPYSRIMTEVMSKCGQMSTILYSDPNAVITKQSNSNDEYNYNFYILPDYSIAVDETNANIRSALALSSTSTKIITSTADFINLPETIQMQSEDIQFFTLPTLTLSEAITGLNSVIVSGSITNMNGFIIIGCIEGKFDENTMTLPTITNIKKGLLQENQPLKAVQMQYSIQNYNVTFEFGGLDDDKDYTFFYCATGDDPSLNAQSTPIETLNAKTLKALTVDINWQKSVKMAIWLAVILIMVGS